MYDVQALLGKLKARGLDLAEGAAVGAAGDVLSWLKEEIEKSPTPFDNVALLILPELKKVLDAELDKINGKVG